MTEVGVAEGLCCLQGSLSPFSPALISIKMCYSCLIKQNGIRIVLHEKFKIEQVTLIVSHLSSNNKLYKKGINIDYSPFFSYLAESPNLKNNTAVSQQMYRIHS